MRISRTTTGRYVDKLIEHLIPLDTENQYLLLMKTDVIATWKIRAKNFQIIPCDIKEFSFAEQWGLRKQINSLKPDLVFFPMVQQPLFCRGKKVTAMLDLTTVRFRNPSKNIVVFWAKQRVYACLNRIVAHTSSQLLTISQFVAQDIATYAHVPLSKITITYLAADPIHEPATPLKSLANKPFIFYVGRPMPHKNLERLLLAHRQLHADHPDLTLALVGKRDELFERLEAFANEHEIPNVVFPDFVSDGQLSWLYQHCKAYVFPSLSEGFGLPGLEAMQAGAPVVSSNATCLPEVYGDAAEYFNPRDPESIADAIRRVIDDPKRRQRLIKQGSERVKQFSWDQTARQTLAVYKEVLGL